MEVMSIRFEKDSWNPEDEDLFQVVTETPHTHEARVFSFSELDGYPETARAVRNHLLGVIASIDWQSRLKEL